jgi:two-component system OmpR family response regulator
VEVLLRRRTQPAAPGARVQVGRLEIDRASREVWKDGAPVRLSATEFDLLCHLMTHPGKAVSKAEILAAVWGHDFHGDFGVVETYIYYLRRKLGSDLIRTVRNFGYLIAA